MPKTYFKQSRLKHSFFFSPLLAMDTTQWPQEIVVKPMNEIIVQNESSNPTSLERKVRPQKEQTMNCPRCNSTNTKFCYYNNYSLTQPRYFCKGCKRYWTEGGTLRNIPFGGGSRKNKRSSSYSISPSSTNSSKKVQQFPKSSEGQDLHLGFSSNDLKTFSQLIQVPKFENTTKENIVGGIDPSTRGFISSFMPMPCCDPSVMFPNGFSMQSEFKPSLGFSLNSFGENGEFENLEVGHDNTNGRVLFPFEDLKQIPNNITSGTGHDPEHVDSTGYWNGVLGSGSW